MAALLSVRAEKAEWWERAITLISNTLGVLALLTVSISPISARIDGGIKDAITALAAAALVGGPYFQMAVLKDPPSRFRDYSNYIGGYADTIAEILTDVRSERRYERLLEVLSLADKNINDVRVQWPAIAKAAEDNLAT